MADEEEVSGRRSGIGGHQSARMLKDEWLTPPDLLAHLGQFDLDPCSPISPPWKTAARAYSVLDNGLEQPWEGRVWMNPPYGAEAAQWLDRLATHGNGLALIFARTETKMFFEHVWDRADALLFLRGRLHFHHVDGTRAAANGGAPSVLIAYGRGNAEVLQALAPGLGAYVDLTAARKAA
jgi:hypothetical protein